MRHPLIIGNWKLNGSIKIVKELIQTLRNKLDDITSCNIVIAPPTIYLTQAQQEITNSKILLGAQDVGINLCGAFTGETSAKMLKDVGVKYVIIGHSERRIYHNESNEYIAQKFEILKSQGLIPVLCIGESEEENIAGKTKQICAKQIDAIINRLGISSFKNSIIAYEPIWAIGTGKPADPKQVQTVHKFIRNYLAQQNAKIAEQVIIQYGGSVNINNATKFFDQLDIDGALIGGASLKSNNFIAIINAAINAKKKIKINL